jgi:hypothetical protein
LYVVCNMPQLSLQLLNYEQQGLYSENEKQWVSVSKVGVCKAASAHAHPRVNDPWEIYSTSCINIESDEKQILIKTIIYLYLGS